MASTSFSSAAAVAVIIPAWNESESIGAVLREVPRETVGQIFVVCGPDDPTARVTAAHGALPLPQHTPGYGAACWLGACAAIESGAEVIVFMDGDYSDPPAALPTMLAPVLANRADLVLGCRDTAQHPHALPPHARFGNRLVLELMRLLLHHRLRDLPSLKVVRSDKLVRLQMSEMTYGWTTELIVKAIRAHWRIEETPIQYRPRLAGESKVSGTVRGTLGAAWKLGSCAMRYSRWTPSSPDAAYLGSPS